MSTWRRTSTIGLTRYGAETLAPTGRQTKADEAGAADRAGDAPIMSSA